VGQVTPNTGAKTSWHHGEQSHGIVVPKQLALYCLHLWLLHDGIKSGLFPSPVTRSSSGSKDERSQTTQTKDSSVSTKEFAEVLRGKKIENSELDIVFREE
jgi:hypothetical protein